MAEWDWIQPTFRVRDTDRGELWSEDGEAEAREGSGRLVFVPGPERERNAEYTRWLKHFGWITPRPLERLNQMLLEMYVSAIRQQLSEQTLFGATGLGAGLAASANISCSSGSSRPHGVPPALEAERRYLQGERSDDPA